LRATVPVVLGAWVTASTAADAAGAAARADGPTMRLGGKVHVDLIRDFGRVDPGSNATLRPSTIPVRCPAAPGCGPDGETIGSVRQSALELEARAPTRLGALRGELSADLFDVPGGETRARLLNAWISLGAFGAGQYYSLFMDIDTFPSVLDYWGPNGMIFLRTPQLRWTHAVSGTLGVALSVESPAAAIDPGKASLLDPALEAAARARRPDLVAKATLEGAPGRLGVAGVLRQIDYEGAGSSGQVRRGSETGWGLNVNGFANVAGRDRVVAQLAFGEGIASYVNDGGVDLALDRRLRVAPVRSAAGYAYYERRWNATWSSAIGASLHRQEPLAGQFRTAFRRGAYGSANVTWAPLEALTVGVELLWGEHVQADGASADDLRLQFSTIYRF
jgi:hypothetical protein